jgi:predicted transcriptional regulator
MTADTTTRSQSVNFGLRESSPKSVRERAGTPRDLRHELVQQIDSRGDVARRDLLTNCGRDVDDAQADLDSLRERGLVRLVWQDGETVAFLTERGTALARRVYR